MGVNRLKKSHSVKTELALTIAVAVFITVALVSVLSNYFLDKEFVSYITRQHTLRKESIVRTVGEVYEEDETTSRRGYGMGMGPHHGEGNGHGWNSSSVASIGNAALYDGLLLHIKDTDGNTVWNAAQQNRAMCRQVITDIDKRMKGRFQLADGALTHEEYPIVQQGNQVGTIEISSYGPYYLSDSDFEYLTSLNKVLWIVGGVSLIIAVLIGLLMARRLSRPILRTSQAASLMAAGNYQARIEKKPPTRELQELTSSINHLATTLDRQDTLRKEMTADLAHELRTPLTTTSTHIEAMMEGVWEPTPERLQSLYEEIGRITRLVEDLEELARIDSENLQLTKQQIRLKDIISEATESFAYKIEEKQLMIKQTLDNTVAWVDKERLYQVVYNLLSNAIKFTPTGGTISIELKQKNSFACIKVRDTGRGIAAEDLPFVFERFYRSEPAGKSADDGSGLGLAISRSIVEAHGGTLAVQSIEEQGSEFTVTIPLQ